MNGDDQESHKANLNWALLEYLWYSNVIQINGTERPLGMFWIKVSVDFCHCERMGCSNPGEGLSLWNLALWDLWPGCVPHYSNNELSVESDRISNIYTSESLWNLQQCFLFSILHIFLLQSLNEASYSNGPSSES